MPLNASIALSAGRHFTGSWIQPAVTDVFCFNDGEVNRQTAAFRLINQRPTAGGIPAGCRHADSLAAKRAETPVGRLAVLRRQSGKQLQRKVQLLCSRQRQRLLPGDSGSVNRFALPIVELSDGMCAIRETSGSGCDRPVQFPPDIMLIKPAGFSALECFRVFFIVRFAIHKRAHRQQFTVMPEQL